MFALNNRLLAPQASIKQNTPYKVLLVPYKNGRRSLRPEEILYIRSDANYCHIISTGEKFIVRITMTEMEKRIMQMPGTVTRFMRIHERYIIALPDVEFNSNLSEVTVSNGDIIPVSVKYRGAISENFEVF